MKESKSWGILWVSFAIGVMASFVQFAVPPLLPVLQAKFGVSYTDAGMLMSIFAFATLICAAPCGLVIQRYGVKRVGLLGMLLLVIGVFLSLLSPTYGLFFFSRIVQGVGFALVAVAAPSAIGQFMPRQLMAMAMGVWSMWIPMGGLIMFFSASRILEHFSLNVYWIVLMAVLIPGAAAFWLVIPSLAQSRQSNAEHAQHLTGSLIWDEIKNPHIWLPALAFAAHTLGVFSFSTWSTTFLTEKLSLSIVETSYVAIIFWITSAISNIIGALIIRKYGNKLWAYIVPPICVGLLWPVCAIPNLYTYYAAATIIGLVSGIMPTIIFASGPLFAKRAAGIGVAMSIIIIGENLGILTGPAFFGMLREFTHGFTASFSMLSIGSVIQIFCFYKIWKTGVLDFTHKRGGQPAAQPPETPLQEKAPLQDA